jgi:cytochrome c peroxidase
MKLPLLLACLAAANCVIFPVAAGDGVLDLTQLANYANQRVPAYITRDNTRGNVISDRGATLGRVLFHDRRLSRNDTVSCSSCHKQERAFSDTAIASIGVNGTTGRHGMRLINARFADETRFFWDERANTLEAQTTQPIRDHAEMGFSGSQGDPAFALLLTKLAAISEYRVLFALTFGDPAITEARVQQALAQFVRSIQSFDSRYDAGRAAVANDNVQFPNFTPAENAG